MAHQGGRPRRQGDIIAEVETDKAAMEMEAFEDGTVTNSRSKRGRRSGRDGIAVLAGEEAVERKKETAGKSRKESRRSRKKPEAGREAESRLRKEPKKRPKPEPKRPKQTGKRARTDAGGRDAADSAAEARPKKRAPHRAEAPRRRPLPGGWRGSRGLF